MSNPLISTDDKAKTRVKWLAAALALTAVVAVSLVAAIAASPSAARAAAPPPVCDHSTGPRTITLDLTTGVGCPTPTSAGACDSSIDPTLPACFTCTSATTSQPLDLDSVTIIVDADVVKEGLRLGAGCTGHIGTLTVITQGGDGVKVVKGAHDLVIGGGKVLCNNPAGSFTTDQYGIRAFGGNRVTFAGMYVNCQGSNSRTEFFVNQVPTVGSGASPADAPNRILFIQGCLASGPWNTALVGSSTNSGIASSVLHAYNPALPGPIGGPTYDDVNPPSGGGTAAANPLDFSNDTPAGQSACTDANG